MKKIAIVSSGRQHLLNLAVELQNLGHKVTFYSFVPNKISQRFGLKKENCCSFFWALLPAIVILRKFPMPRLWRAWLTYFIDVAVDILAGIFLKRCDVYIGRWFVGYRSAIVAKKRFNAKIIDDVGVQHPLFEQKIVRAVGGYAAFTRSVVRDLKTQALSDKIVIPSDSVARSFVSEGADVSKLFINSYGVDLEVFGSTVLSEKPYDILMTGNWCLRKGCDLLAEACEKLNLKLLHVGGLSGDCAFPRGENFKHIDAVPQNDLPKYYAMAKVFALPSRSEGLALVQVQAIVCGLPLVYSSESGGAVLHRLSDNSPFMFCMKALTADALAEALRAALEKSKEVPLDERGGRDYIGEHRSRYSWTAYGERYSEFLESL